LIIKDIYMIMWWLVNCFTQKSIKYNYISINYSIEWNGIDVTFHGSSILLILVKLVSDEKINE
jgi:hypothetical protein